jgi:hypothetical protein
MQHDIEHRECLVTDVSLAFKTTTPATITIAAQVLP